MKTAEWFKKLLEENEKDPEYWKEHVRVLNDEFTVMNNRIHSLESAMQEYINEHDSENQLCGENEFNELDFCDKWNLKFKQLLTPKQSENNER